MDNLTVPGGLLYALGKGAIYLLVFWGMMAIAIVLINKEKGERIASIKAVGATILIMGCMWFWSAADLKLPAFDQIAGSMLEMQPAKTATVASVPTKATSKATPAPTTPAPSATAPTKSFEDNFSLDAGKETDGNYQLYTIQPGDTIFSISSRFNVSQDELAGINGVSLKDYSIKAGKTLKIPIK